jgi:FKBP-type peptidyl-prolyl cis-trans isomerase
MKTISLAVAALINSSAAIHHKQASGLNATPDVFGPNGRNYSNTDASQDLSQIGIDIHSSAGGNSCQPGQWTTVHWVGSLPDGRVVTDSRAEPGGLPRTFALGASEVFRCWDLAIPKLHEGDKATLHCPAFYAWGGAYTQAPLGGEPIPLNSDVNFDIEIVSCNHTPHFTQYYDQPVTTTMQPGRCMWLHLEESDDTGNDMVLTEQDGHAIVHHREYNDPAQQWYIDGRGQLHPASSASGVFLDERANLSANNHIQWFFDSENHAITTHAPGLWGFTAEKNRPSTTKYLAVSKEQLMPGSNVQVLMARQAEQMNHNWRIEYCEHWKA